MSRAPLPAHDRSAVLQKGRRIARDLAAEARAQIADALARIEAAAA